MFLQQIYLLGNCIDFSWEEGYKANLNWLQFG